MGLLYAADILGFALFQLMQVSLSNVDGASTQIVLVLTSFCYMPAVGIAMAGTTLVGQAIGAKTPEWAFKVGNGIIALAVTYMGLIGVIVAAAGKMADALVHQRGGSAGRGGGREGIRAALDRRRVSAVRRLQHRERRVPARRRRRARTLDHGARLVVVVVRAAGPRVVVSTGRRMGSLAAAIWPGSRSADGSPRWFTYVSWE